jgi:hypothetical protein
MESVPTMKKSCLFALLLSCIGTVGISQTVDVSTLSDYEKQVHRVGWCYQSHVLTMDHSELERFFDDFYTDTFEVHELLNRNGFFERDHNNISRKARDDMQTKFLIGAIEYTNQYVDDCNADMVSILKEKYIPNFSYMEK